MKNIQNLTIDINKKPFQTITANVGEVASRFIRITILDSNIPVNLTGVEVLLYAEKPDNKKVFNNVVVEDETNGIILAELTSQILAVEGLVKLTLLLVKNGSKLCSKQFLLNVDSSIVDDNAIESTNEFSALINALDRVEDICNKFEDINPQPGNPQPGNNGLLNLNEFKKLDGDIDDTERIQRALDHSVKNNLTLLIPDGTYTVSQKGSTFLAFPKSDRGYCIYKENATIKVLQVGTIQVDLTQTGIQPNIFIFKNCEVSWSGGTFKGTNNNVKLNLYSGAAFVLDGCYNSRVDNVKVYSTKGGVYLMRCTDSVASNCYFENTIGDMMCCGSAFGIYGGSYNEIFKCTSYGSTGDGDITVYGTGYKNKITNSKCFNSLHDLAITNITAQGICVDAGQMNCTVSECYAYGYYYGIDVKTNIENCVVINNIVERCKVGLTLRWGEAGGNNIFTTFRGNTILNPHNGANDLILNDSYWCGILIESSHSADIKDNVIIKEPNYTLDLKGTGIMIFNDPNLDDVYNRDISITGNTFFDQPSLGAFTTALIMDSIYIDLARAVHNVNITNNTFGGGYPTKVDSNFIKVVKGRCINISNNLFGRIDNPNGAILVSNTKLLNIGNNTFKPCKGALILSGVQELNISSNTFEECMDWKTLITGSITGACIFSNNIYKNVWASTGSIVSITGGKKLITSNNIIYMNREYGNEFTLNGSINNVIDVNNYITN